MRSSQTPKAMTKLLIYRTPAQLSPKNPLTFEDDIIDLDEAVADDESTMGEDDIIASAIVDSLDVDDDDLQEDRIRLADESEIAFEQDDDVIMLNEEDEGPAAVSNHTEPETEKDEAVFDSEEEIVLDYESDEDE